MFQHYARAIAPDTWNQKVDATPENNIISRPTQRRQSMLAISDEDDADIDTNT